MKSTEFITESSTPYDHLIGKETATMKGGVRYPGTIEKIVQDQYGKWKAKAAFSNEPGSYFYKEISDDGNLTEGDDRNIKDVKVNHSEIFEFLAAMYDVDILQDARVSTYDVTDTHFVIVRVASPMSIDELRRLVARHGNEYQYMSDMIQGTGNGFRYKAEDKTDVVKWTFILSSK